MSVADDFTPIQWAALQATAGRHLRDPEELGREMRSLVWIDPLEEQARAAAAVESAVKEDLTPTTELPAIDPERFTVTFYAAGGPS